MRKKTKSKLLQIINTTVIVVLALVLSVFTTIVGDLGIGEAAFVGILIGGFLGLIAALINGKIREHYRVKRYFE